MPSNTINNIKIKGEVNLDSLHRILYATDASAYRELPIGVAYPKDTEDIISLVDHATNNKISLIPRAAGTSLAGQVVGSGLVVDISKHMNNILEINTAEKWIKVQPGVVLETLNQYCKPHNLFFGPETSTANRCCIGGMVGNNSCGSHSLIYGSTRDHIRELKVVLSDGSEAIFKDLTTSEIEEKNKLNNLEGNIYRDIITLLSDKNNQKEINENFPDKNLSRRNTGYAIDELLQTNYFSPTSDKPFNLSKLIAGSEGTLAFITEIKLNLVELPPKEKAIIAVHCNSLEESFEANLVVLRHNPVAIELMDNTILELSKKNIIQNRNRFFIKDNPPAILIVELAEHTRQKLDAKAVAIETALKAKNYGYHYPIIYGEKINAVWELRKAGLGLLTCMVGDAKPISVIEDTAVTPERLPAYMADFKKMLSTYNVECVYHAHIATGELHLRPILNLKDNNDKELFKKIALDSVYLVKKHKGSLSGEHGDGRLRGEFIPILLGEHCYGLLKEIKQTWDPNNILNANKIIDTPAMDDCLRYEKSDLKLKTYFDFSKQQGWLRAIEQCNGSGDCRKSALIGGNICPTFKATEDEAYSTRARANILRELLIHPTTERIFDQKEIFDILDSCIACKACKAECPSSVDMARYKSEFLQHYYNIKGISLRAFLVGNISEIQKLGMIFPNLYNFIARNSLTSSILKKILGFAPQRSLPILYKIKLKTWIKKNQECISNPKGKLYLFIDEFSNYMDVEVGTSFVKLLNKLGYYVIVPKHIESGRTEISKGMLKKAKRIANKNIELLKDIIADDIPLVGIEPSCILSFRDEYPDLVDSNLKQDAINLSKKVFLYDEFIVNEIEKGNIKAEQFNEKVLNIKLHGHCHQKSLASVEASKIMLELPQNYKVEIIPSSCCGMAGSFGYEKEHYDLSFKIGETILFPTIRNTDIQTLISAPGISCRQQIKDGTGREALHPIEILYNAL